MSKQIIGIYHKDCTDGTSAAAVLLKKFPDAGLFPLYHSYKKEDIQPILDSASEDAEIYTVDCALGIREFLDKGHSVTTIDHHIGIKDFLEGLEKEYEKYSYVFDNEKSGASLTWSYCFPDEEEPELIKYVEDRDLWKWQYGDDTRNVNNYISMFWNDPKSVLEILLGDLTEVKEKGSVISKYIETEVEKLIKTPSLNMKIGSHTIPVFNITSSYKSECAKILSEKLDTAVAMFIIKGDLVNLSLRSKEHHSPTSMELAQALGGNGHKCAAGADIPLQKFIQAIT